jgi:AcrR family transcriptional regulator
MTEPNSIRLKSRKQPTQARSQATVAAIFEATIQVLLHGGASALTTNRVADRAGVSIGTLYQYFPGKEALLYALVSRHLDRASTAVELSCQHHRGMPLMQCSDAFVNAYIDAKTSDPEASRALYHASTELDMKDLGTTMIERLHGAVRDMLANIDGPEIKDLDSVVFSWVAVVTGGTRQIFDEEDTTLRLPIFREQLLSMSRAYLQAAQS